MKALKTVDYIKYAFITLVVLELIACALGIEQLRRMTRPLLMPILLIYFRKGLSGRITLSFLFGVGAIMFSFFGDALFLFSDEESYFLLTSLASFSIGNVLYIFSFGQAVDQATKPIPLLTKILYAIPFLILLIVLMLWILPNVEELSPKILVSLYSVVLIFMVLSAIYRNQRADQKGVNQVILGTIFLLFSYLLLTLNRFVEPMANADVWIVLPYVLAQWNIVNGLQKHYNEV